jgi:tetratricopeptide (TPR) repeat protein
LEQKFNNADFNTINDLYVQALDKTGMYHDILVAYALYLEENGKYDLAINYWEKAIEKNPSKKSEYQENIRKLEEKKELSK